MALAAAVVAFVVLHVVAIATQAPAATNTLAGLGWVVQHQLIHVLAEFLQYIIPAGLLIGTTVGYSNKAAGMPQRTPELRRQPEPAHWARSAGRP